MNSYNLELLILQLEEALEESMGEVTPEIESMLNVVDANFEEFIDFSTYKINTLKGEINAIKDEKERLSKRAESKDTAAKLLKIKMIDLLRKNNKVKLNKKDEEVISYKTSLGSYYSRFYEKFEYDEDEISDKFKDFTLNNMFDDKQIKTLTDKLHEIDELLVPNIKGTVKVNKLKPLSDDELKNEGINKLKSETLIIRQ